MTAPETSPEGFEPAPPFTPRERRPAGRLGPAADTKVWAKAHPIEVARFLNASLRSGRLSPAAQASR